MFNALNSAANGMTAQTKQIETISNNIANAETGGFKKSPADLEDLLYNTSKDPGAATSATTRNPAGVQIGTGSRVVGTTREHTQGSLKITNNELDIAIAGDGFLPIQQPNGEIAYTRSGNFMKDAEGRLVTHEGHALVPEIVIPPDAVGINIASDGRVQVKVGNTVSEVGQIQLVNFSNPAGLHAMGGNKFERSPSSGEPVTSAPGEGGTGNILHKSLESSNVDPVNEMTNMIRAQRSFELGSRVMTTVDQMMGSLGQIK